MNTKESNITRKDIEALSHDLFTIIWTVRWAIHDLWKTVIDLNQTIINHTKSTDKLSRQTLWLNRVIAIAAVIWGIKVFFDIYVHFTK